MGLDLVLPRRAGDRDESIASFMRRRLGDEALDRLAEPLLGGIYAGDPEKLSIQATFPQLVQLERQHRSLVLGMLRSRGRRAGRPPSPFHSLATGMGDLPDALAKRIGELGGTIRERSRVTSIARSGAAYRVTIDSASGEQAELEADEVVLAAPLGASGELLARVDEGASRILLGVPHVSTATCLLAYARGDVAHPLDAVGAILPKREGSRAMALTFATSKWRGRAPADVAVIRVFLGGYTHEHDAALPDDELVRLARAELLSILGITAAPRVARVFRFPSASPQPLVGHLVRMAELRDRVRAHAGLHVGGSAIDGVGIPDCVRQGADMAARILAAPARSS
jgi:oxygen-dependent protoporphyrinogen oxidase